MNSMDFLFIKAHFPAHNSPQLGYTTPGYTSKRGKNGEASQKEVFLAAKINLHLPTKKNRKALPNSKYQVHCLSPRRKRIKQFMIPFWVYGHLILCGCEFWKLQFSSWEVNQSKNSGHFTAWLKYWGVWVPFALDTEMCIYLFTELIY